MAVEKPDSLFDEWLDRKSKRKKLLNDLLSQNKSMRLKGIN